MAVWQYSMRLVPRTELASLMPSLSGVLPEHLFDDTAWWATTQPRLDFAAQLSSVLPEVKGWNTASRVWGPEDSDTVTVSYKSGKAGVGVIDEFWLRLDLRYFRPDVLRAAVALAQECGGWWLTGEADRRVLLSPQYEDVITAIRGSSAARFVADPHAFVSSLGRRA